MNIFYLHEDPTICAQHHCDKHVVKMAVEYAQLLSTAHRVIDGKHWYGRTTTGRRISRFFHDDPDMNTQLYKASHLKHPSALWVRQSDQNYTWLFDMWTALSNEYTHRYGRVHESFRKLEYYLLLPPKNIAKGGFTQPTPAMGHSPISIVEGDSLMSYHNYYWNEKRRFAKWTNRRPPEWWLQRIREDGGEGKQAETIVG